MVGIVKFVCENKRAATLEEECIGVLEPYDEKLSRTVLRGGGSRKTPRLPGVKTGEEVIFAGVVSIEFIGGIISMG